MEQAKDGKREAGERVLFAVEIRELQVHILGKTMMTFLEKLWNGRTKKQIETSLDAGVQHWNKALKYTYSLYFHNINMG